MTGGNNRDIIQVASGNAAVRALGVDTKINLNPIERIIGEYDLDKLKLVDGGTAAQ